MNLTVTHGTFTIERQFPSSPERVFAALSNPDFKRRWYSTAAESFEMDFRVGGRDRAQSRMGADTPFAGAALVNETTYLDIVPNHRVVIAYTMALDGRRFSASLGTFELVPADTGTTLVFTDQGAYFENSDGPAMREHGWRALIDQLAEVLASEFHARA